MSKLFLSLLLIFPSLISSAPQPDQIIEIFRHGARAPTTAIDPSWPQSQWGILTPVGMRQQYILGKVLSQKYPSLLSSGYDYNQIYMLSDNTSRCVQSAEAQLYGMYLGTGPALRKDYPREEAVPPFNDPRVEKIADSMSNSEAVPNNNIATIVNIVGESNAIIFQGGGVKYCPNMPTWQQQNINDQKTKQAWGLFQDTIDNVNSYLNESQKIKTTNDVLLFGDTMIADLADNRPLVGGFSDPKLISNLTYAMSWISLHTYFGQDTQKQLFTFNFLDAVLKELVNFRKGQNAHKAALFSAHDSNLNGILSTFGVLHDDCLMANFLSSSQNKTIPYPNCYYPLFGASITIEFYNDTRAPYVKFYYNNNLITLCNGKESCDYDDFLVFANNAIGNNNINTYRAKCGVTPTEELMNLKASNMSNFKENGDLMFGALIGLTILCIFLVGKIFADKKKYEKLVSVTRNGDSVYQRIV